MEKVKLFRYNISQGQVYTPGQIVQRVKNCNGFTAVNVGDDLVTVNGFPLYPGTPGTNIGDSISFGGNAGEIYLGTIDVVFANVGVLPQVAISQKYYAFDDQKIELI
jgi:hypothetical protein